MNDRDSMAIERQFGNHLELTIYIFYVVNERNRLQIFPLISFGLSPINRFALIQMIMMPILAL